MQGTRDTSAPVLVECTRCCAPPFQTELDHQNMEELGNFITHPLVLAVLAIAALVGAAASVWSLIITLRQSARTKDIERREEKLALPPEFLDGLPEAVNRKLRAAYQEARSLQLEGYAARSREKHLEAIDRFTRALALAENDSQRAALHNLRGNSYESISQYKEAQADCEQVIKLSERIPEQQDAAQARAVALGNLGVVHGDCGELAKAEESHQQALKIHRETGDRLGEAVALGNLGLVYYLRGGPGDLDRAEEHCKRALEIDAQIGNRRGEAIQLRNLGNVYAVRGELERAEDHHRQALDIHRELGNRLGEADQLGNLGIVYGRRGGPDNLDAAEGYVEQALGIHREIGNRRGEAEGLSTLGIIYGQRGGPDDLDKAEEFLRQALEIDTHIGNRLGQAADLTNLGNVYLQRGGSDNLDKAEECLKQALDIDRETGNRLGEAIELDTLGHVYLQRGDAQRAKDYLQRARALYQLIGAGGEGPENVRQALERLAEQERQQQERGE